MLHQKVAAGFLCAILAATVFVYTPGLSGSFLFDDFYNLQTLGYFGGVSSWDSAKAFVFSGNAGPTGRPLALATFLLNDQYWPSQPMSFKYTNLMIHLLVGLGVCWATLNLLRVLGFAEDEAIWIALLSAAVWLLHPYFVSTTLYVIQRMTQLAALFSIYGIAAYLHGRQIIKDKALSAYAWMTGGIVVGGGLAILSKENGALLPVLILAVEMCLPKVDSKINHIQVWQFLFLYIPGLALFFYLVWHIDFSANPWPNRSFNQVERLLTEANIVSEYLYDLFVPKFEGHGLYQDGFQVSKGFFQPAHTFFSIIFLALIAVFSLIWRRKYPLLALPLLFFFAGHLLESTVIGLELHFEHRNYLPAAFIFLPVAAGVIRLSKPYSSRLSLAVAVVLICFLSFMTWQRATLWGGGYRLLSYWALKNPDSARAQSSLAQIMIESGRADEARALLERSVARLPDSAMLITNLLKLKVAEGNAEENDFVSAGNRLAVQPFDAQAVKGIDQLVDFVTAQETKIDYAEYMQNVLIRMAGNDQYSKFPLFVRFLPYQQGRLFLHQKNPQMAHDKFLMAMRLYGNIDSAMEMVVQTAGYHYYDFALSLLDEAEKVLSTQDDKSLIRTRDIYRLEIIRIRKQLNEDIVSVNQ